ncbi:MAG: PilN domain-containing protein [candidate division Zixibacteria bacterium]|nr:PilN domain-containing protein [candidate division Zixibacteria bacterium]
MIEINLLPKDYNKRSFEFSLGKTGLYVVGGAAGVVLMLIGITLFQMNQISTLNDNIERARQRADMLRKDIRVVEALEDVKVKITNRMKAVETLDSHRSVWVRVLEDMARNVPDFVWLARFDELPTEKADDSGSTPALVRRAEIEGHAFTLNAMAAFMINMMRSDYFDEVELKGTSEVWYENHSAFNFILTCDLHYLSDEDARGMLGKVGDEGQSAPSKASHKSLN